MRVSPLFMRVRTGFTRKIMRSVRIGHAHENEEDRRYFGTGKNSRECDSARLAEGVCQKPVVDC